MLNQTVLAEIRSVKMEPGTDLGTPLLEISRLHGKSIVSLLADIQGYMTPQKDALGFLEKLECLRVPEAIVGDAVANLRREHLNAFHNSHYLALSYTWDACDFEDSAWGRYYVERREASLAPEVSKVRNCVWDRITNYMRACRIKHLWIDRHCITQEHEKDCKTSTCSHRSCKHHRDGMQVMDRVYSESRYPVALLGRPIQHALALNLLAKLLGGRLTSESENQSLLRTDVSPQEASCVLRLLRDITDDRWWRRGWTFQENYLAGRRMKLLISHPPDLEPLKKNYTRLFGNFDGEICFSSVDFSIKATMFCVALQQCTPRLYRLPNATIPEVERDIESVLSAAGRYRILLGSLELMTPRVLRDIEKRDMSKRWDTLPIAANACQYTIRLDHERLESEGKSLSMSVFAQCLLNGEVLHNDRRPILATSGMTGTEYLKTCLFGSIKGPTKDRSLTFNKSCRFPTAFLSESGTYTWGHLWKLSPNIIDTSCYPSDGIWVEDAHGTLELVKRRRLACLAKDLQRRNYPLHHEIWRYLDRDAEAGAGRPSDAAEFAELYLHLMADEVANAIGEGKRLRLGCLWDPRTREGGSYMAVFVWDGADDAVDCFDEEMSSDDSQYTDRSTFHAGCSAFAFTASQPEGLGSMESNLKDLDRHVSFEVRVENPEAGFNDDYPYPTPRLRIRRWLNGLCFFYGRKRVEVMFPWPKDLRLIGLC